MLLLHCASGLSQSSIAVVAVHAVDEPRVIQVCRPMGVPLLIIWAPAREERAKCLNLSILDSPFEKRPIFANCPTSN